MTVNYQTGNVGINSASPQYTLDVVGTVRATSFIGEGIGGAASQWTTSGTNIYITDSNVGIGTNNPLARLHVHANDSLFGTNTQWASYRQQAYGATSSMLLPTAAGAVNGVNITALNQRTRTSTASSLAAVSTWVTRASPTNNQWYKVCWAPELSRFVAVATSGTGNRVMTSDDGITWVTRASAADVEWWSVCWAPELSRFVSVAYNGGINNSVMSSDDGGITWQTRTSHAHTWMSVCWAPELSRFVAVASSGNVMTSVDGITWVTRTSAASNAWTSVCWAPELSRFVAVSGGNVTTGNNVMTSEDGITWQTRETPANKNWRSVCWAPELSRFVAVASYIFSSGTLVMTSDDGMTWQTRTSPTNNNSWTSVCWAPELSRFVAVSGDNIVMTSNDGITWLTRTTPANSWTDVCWAPELSRFVAVATSGTGNRVMTSAIGMPNSQSAVLANPAHVTVNQAGNVGIGSTNPSHKLFVDGSIRGSSVYVQNSLLSTNGNDLFIVSGATAQAIHIRPNGPGGGGLTTVGQSIFQPTATSLQGDALIINSGGNVGIGTNNPTAKLQIYESSEAQSFVPFGLVISHGQSNRVSSMFKIENNTTSLTMDSGAGQGLANIVGGADIRDSGGYKYTSTRGASRIALGDGTITMYTGNNSSAGQTNGTPVVWNTVTATLNSTGVGIGTLNPDYILHVQGQIYASLDITAFSDKRVKGDIQVIPDAMQKIKSLSGYTFFRTDGEQASRRYVGVIAQEVERVLPEAVYTDVAGFKSVAYGNLAALFIEAIKEIDHRWHERVAALEADVAMLKVALGK
jgi:hypothetical protein